MWALHLGEVPANRLQSCRMTGRSEVYAPQRASIIGVNRFHRVLAFCPTSRANRRV